MADTPSPIDQQPPAQDGRFIRFLASIPGVPAAVVQEARDVKVARVSIGIFSVLALLLGVWLGAWLASKYYADLYGERIAILEEKVDSRDAEKTALESQLKELQPVTPRYDLEMSCGKEMLAPVVGHENRIEAVVFGQMVDRLVVGQYWGISDKGQQLPWREKCTLTNRGNVPLSGFYLDIDFVVRDWKKGKGSGEVIRESKGHSIFVNGSLQPEDSRRLWLWVQSSNDYVAAEFRDRVMAGTLDGRGRFVQMRQTGERVFTLSPKD